MLSVTVYRYTNAFINPVLDIPLLYLCLQIVVIYRQAVCSNPVGDIGCVVCCECIVLSGRGLCDRLITRPEESYRCGASSCVI